MNPRGRVKILTKTFDVLPFTDEIRRNADNVKQALGFLPGSAYEEAALQQKLLVAVMQANDNWEYAGHLLFGGVLPQSRIFQVFVKQKFRRHGIAEKLIQSVVRRCETQYFLSIRADVASDLISSNKFWDRVGFAIARTRSGGKSRNRTINIRVRDLDTPNLFNIVTPTRINRHADLRIISRLAVRTPIYLIDLNVLFDVVRQRLRAKEAGKVFGAGLNNLVRIAISQEFVTELERSSKPISDDPILQFALQLPRMPVPPAPIISDLSDELARLVFPERFAANTLSKQDRSDLIHLATAIHHKSSGFITGEKAILRAGSQIQLKFGVDIVGPEEFAALVDTPERISEAQLSAALGKAQVSILNLEPALIAEARLFLEEMQVPAQMIGEVLLAGDAERPRQRLLVKADEVIGYVSWDVTYPIHNNAHMFMCVDEQNSNAETIIDSLLERACIDTSRDAPALINLHELPGHSATRRVAIVNGFRPAHGQNQSSDILQKLCAGSVVTKKSWEKFINQLKALAGIDLPNTMPQFTGYEQKLSIKNSINEIVHISIKDLKSLLSPVLLLFPSRPGVVLPIRSSFSAELLGRSPQYSFLTPPEAIMLSERAYFSSARTAATIHEGAPLLFYESSFKGGRSAIVAVARAATVRSISKNKFDQPIKRRGVLDQASLNRLISGKSMLATTFDNIMHFEKPVPFRRLREIGCVDGTNLVTAKHVTYEHLSKIIEEGRPESYE